MIKKVISAFLGMSKVALNLLYYGLPFAIGLSLLGILLYYTNTTPYIIGIATDTFCEYVVATGLALTTVFVLGSMFIDFVHKIIE